MGTCLPSPFSLSTGHLLCWSDPEFSIFMTLRITAGVLGFFLFCLKYYLEHKLIWKCATWALMQHGIYKGIDILLLGFSGLFLNLLFPLILLAQHAWLLCVFLLSCRTHMQDLKDVTNNVHYENYRSKKLAAVTCNGVDTTKTKGQLTK